MDELLQEFIAETRETLEALAGEVVAWEADPADRARLDAIFRFVHTVKGSCGFLDLPRLAKLSHAAEDALATVRTNERIPDKALVDAVLAIVDRIGELVEAIDSGTSLDDTVEELLIAALAPDAEPGLALAASAPTARSASRSVRLSVDLLDRMMSGMSDMVLARNELARRLREGAVDPRIEAALERLSSTVAEMRDTVTRTRMQKVDALFSALPRLVRDIAAECGKAVQLQIEGADVELDREMIELIRDPLTHIVRNAIDHGIEQPAARRAARKRETGRLTVAARQSGNQILIEVSDDGRGIDTGRLAAKALKLGLIGDAELARLDEQARCELVFAPGLSSRDEVTSISGRGVGMDVVRANVEQVGGRVSLRNAPGYGLSIIIQVPLTLSIMSTVVIGVGRQHFALARQSVEEIVAIGGDSVRLDHLGDAPVATVRGARLPLVKLGTLLGMDTGDPATLAIIGTRDGNYALGIDRVVDTEELVVKPAAPAVMATGLYAGHTLPDSGRPMLLIDGAGIAAVAGLRFRREFAAIEADDEAEVVEPGLPALLFDDLDGQRRVVALAAIDRVETVPAIAVRRTGGRLRLAIGGAIVPLLAAGPLAEGDMPVLRLTDGEAEIAYAITEALDIVALPSGTAARAVGGEAIAGVVLIDDEQVEVVDAHALFAAEDAGVPIGTSTGAGATPLVLLHGPEGGWLDAFLRPTLEAAGYRCATRLPAGERAAVALQLDDVPSAAGADTPTVRLRRARAGGADTIYRYDRDALLAALATRVGAGR